MKLAMRQNKWLWLIPLSSALLASVVVVAVWIGAVALRADAQPKRVIRKVFVPAYSSLGDLSTHADVVVVGTVERSVAKWTDRGAGGDGLPRPYIVYQIDVQETLKGETDDLIYVLRIEPVYFAGEGQSALGGVPLTELRVGQTVALYLEEVMSETPPIITFTDRFYVPLGFDNGVFDVSSGESGAVGRVDDNAVVRPRGIRKDMFAEGSGFMLSEIKQAIEPVSDEVGPEAGSDDTVPGSGPGDAVPGSGPGDAVPGSGPGATGSVGSVN